jgi:predicted RNA binding protein YcfA (HicA-like mRNA interferase family)
MKRRELERRLRELGWRLARHGARHDVWARGEEEIAVPRHVEVNERTAAAILREAGEGRR